jgi:hypothetical protein
MNLGAIRVNLHRQSDNAKAQPQKRRGALTFAENLQSPLKPEWLKTEILGIQSSEISETS